MIKDTKYTLNLVEENKKEVETNKISGCLYGVMLSAEKPCQITVVYKDYPYAQPLLQVSGFSGQKWFSLRTESSDWNGDKFMYSSSEVILNDKLIISVGGSKGNKVEVTLRSEE